MTNTYFSPLGLWRLSNFSRFKSAVHLLLGALPLVFVGAHETGAAQRPNVVMVITDDQGYGDLGCTGNPVIKTPHIDHLAGESVGLSDYHVAPTCSPTRCALLTGHWTNRTGVWHTIMGRSMLRENEVTIADILGKSGYATGMFGKWHLGDNFPYRPHDRGFDLAYYHGGGGIGQTPDVWNNDYFDDTYFRNGKEEAAKGFCTDVFFEEGRKFIREQVKAGKPFFTYISTNAPHGPLLCPEKYMDLYEGQNDKIKAFFGMITNIDENVGKLRALLDELKVTDNTIFIFTTDNGTASGREVYNAGMRGQKGSEYEGGHRVPMFIHWPKAGLTKERTVPQLTHMVDFVPTLLDFCQVEKPSELHFDGVSLNSLIMDLKGAQEDPLWETRCVISDSQRVRDPIKWRKSAVMSGKWRLINGEELYHIGADPSQEKDVAAENPEKVQRLKAYYEAWWSELEPTFAKTTEIYLGSPQALEVTLTAHDWIQEIYPPWNQSGVRNGEKNRRVKSGKALKYEGHWAVKVIESGEYEFELRRYPREADLTLQTATPAMPVMPGATPNYSATEGAGLAFTEAVFVVNEKEISKKPIAAEDKSVTFTHQLEAGSHRLSPKFMLKEGGELGAYYVYVKKK